MGREDHKVQINGTTTPKQESIKYLGVTIDNDLSWKSHVGTVRRGMLAAIGIIRRVSACLPLSTKRMLYNVLVLPYADYCQVVWHPCSFHLIQSLERVQNLSMRVVLSKPPRTPIKCPPQKPTWMDHSPQEASQCTLVPGPLVCV